MNDAHGAAGTSGPDVGAITLEHLEAVVAIDSQSDERSTTIPSSEGQRRLARLVGERFARYGCTVEQDAHANVIATLPGRGAGAGKAPIALMAHVDTARGTAAVPSLERVAHWDGAPVRYPENAALVVDVATYPVLAAFVGHTLVHGPGRSPFGLDDKLGLSHMLTLARLLSERPEVEHPPLVFIGRPDEEIGRMEAVVGLAGLLAARGIRAGYTIDGILPFEVNAANFNGAGAALTFPAGPAPAFETALALEIAGVNTHGATARAEGHRAATRLAVEILSRCGQSGDHVVPLAFDSDPIRDCDATLVVGVPADDEAEATERLRIAAEAVVAPHRARGADARVRAATDAERAKATGATGAMLAWVERFLATASTESMPLLAEESDGWQGYSHPYRARTSADGTVHLDIRIRDFDKAALVHRKQHIARLADGHALCAVRDQYVDMAPQLASLPLGAELVAHAVAAGKAIGVAVSEEPIRGGTGVDPFLDEGVAIVNLGTGYFAPESEKELTSLELMAGHAQWLLALVSRLATA